MPEELKLKSEDLELPKKSRKKITIILVVGAGIIFLGILGYFLWKNYESKKAQLEELKNQVEKLQQESNNLNSQNSQIEENQNQEPAAQEENKEDPYSGWNTYTNSEIGYQLKYPADWKVKETDQWSELTEQQVKYITIDSPDKKYFLYWGLKRKDDDFGISDRTGLGAGDLIQEGSVTILGTNVAVKKLVYKNKVKEYFFPTAGSTKTSDGKYFFSAALSSGSSASYDSLNMQGISELEKAKLILASVTIISRAVAETGCASTLTSADKLAIKTWKKIENSKYDYSFKYPEDWTIKNEDKKRITLQGDSGNTHFQFLSAEMTALDYLGYTVTSTKNAKVACQSAKETFLANGDDRMIFTQFKKDGTDHLLMMTYKYLGASLSSDMVEMYDLILKSVEFK